MEKGLVIIFLALLLILLPAVSFKAHPTTTEQKGGTIVKDYFGPIYYTNETDRKISVAISVANFTAEELQDMFEIGLDTFTLKVDGNVFHYEEKYPILLLVNNETLNVGLDDGRLDSYKVCVYFEEYDSKDACEGINTVKKVTNDSIDASAELSIVYRDMLRELAIEADEADE